VPQCIRVFFQPTTGSFVVQAGPPGHSGGCDKDFHHFRIMPKDRNVLIFNIQMLEDVNQSVSYLV
jgi:hypothetical protein